MRNWRGKVSAGLKDRRQTVKQLVVSDWFAFEQVEYARELLEGRGMGDTTAEQMAAMLATARHFTFYLQEKGKLKSVFQDLQKLIPGSGSGEPAKDSIEILEDHLGKTRDRIENDFVVWFTKIERKAKGHKEGVWRQEDI